MDRCTPLVPGNREPNSKGAGRVVLALVLLAVVGLSLTGVVAGTGGEPVTVVSNDTASGETPLDSSSITTEVPPEGETAPQVPAGQYLQTGPVSPTADPVPANPVGDANEDDGITIADAQAIANDVIGNPPSTYNANLANVTRADAGVQIADAQRVAEFTIGSVAPANVNISGFAPPATLEAGATLTGSVTLGNAGGLGTIHEVTYRVATDSNFDDVVYEESVEVVDLAPATFDGNETTVQFTVTPAVSGGEYTQGLFSEVPASDNASATAPLSVADGAYAGGNGTVADPYRIATWEHLDNVRDNRTANFTLVNDLDRETAGYQDVAGPGANGGQGFEPLPRFGEFTGTFDGNGHAIANLSIRRPDGFTPGLFGENAGTIQRVSLVDVDVTGDSEVGGLVGRNEGLVRDSHVAGTVSGKDFEVGGVVGENSGEIRNVSSSAEVSGTNPVGGIAGINRQMGEIRESYATGDVTGAKRVGGLVGTQYDSASIRDSYATGTVVGSAKVGGLLGETFGTTVTGSYAAGRVISGGDAGGLVGSAFGQGTVINESYWNVETTGLSSAAGRGSGASNATGLTTAEMRGGNATGNMSGLNFTTTWDVVDTQQGGERVVSYPYLTANAQEPAPGLGAPGEPPRESPEPGGPSDLYAGGNGTAGNPYQIANWTHLDSVDENPAANFTLVNDINRTTPGYEAAVGGESEFAPIGPVFRGTFDGDGNVVADLVIDRPRQSFVGLFSSNLGTIERVGVENASITGDSPVGGLVGQSSGVVRQSYSTADILGGFSVGGLVGEASDGAVTESYATGSVAGRSGVGGLVGSSGADLNDSYAAGRVAGGERLGGVAGSLSFGSNVAGVYWNVETSGQGSAVGDGSTAQGVTGLTTAEMRGASAAGNLTEFDFAGTWASIDTQRDGERVVSYPYLTGTPQEPAPGLGAPEERPDLPDNASGLYAGGSGTAEDPFQVANWTHLDNVRVAPDLPFVLTSDLDAGTAGYEEVVGGGAGFEPIGTAFTGVFDGDGHAIADLSIDRPFESKTGLFATSAGTVQNVSLENASVTGDGQVGGFVGLNIGLLREVSIAGNVSGNGFQTGGLVGENNRGKIRQSYSAADIDGRAAVGGLVGTSFQGIVNNSYTTGSVAGTFSVGGIFGEIGGDLNNSYAAGNVTGGDQNEPGGIAGRSFGSPEISDSYWDVNATGQSVAVGEGPQSAAGLTTAEMRGTSAPGNMSGFDFADTWAVVDTQSNESYPYLVANPQEPAPGGGRLLATGIAGTVESDGDPVEGATVTLGDRTAETNENGSFTVPGEPGQYNLTVTGLGIEGTTVGVEVQSGDEPTDVGIIDVNATLGLAAVDGQPDAVTAGSTLSVTLEAANAETLTVALTGNYAEADADLFVDGNSTAFGQQTGIDNGSVPVTVETTVGQFGDLGLQHTVSGDGDTLTVSTGPTNVTAALPGEQVWAFTDPASGVRSSPTVVDGAVYVGANETTGPTSDGALYAVDAASGEKRWTFTGPSDSVFSSPTVVEGTVYAGAGRRDEFDDPTLYALDAATGETEWTFDESYRIQSSPTVAGNTVYVGGSDDTLYALNASTGETEWQFEPGTGQIRASPTVVNGTVYVGSFGTFDQDNADSALYAVDAANGTQQWAYTAPAGIIRSSPTVAGGTVYVGSQDSTLYAVDAENGTEEWRYTQPSSSVPSSPTVSDGTVYVGSFGSLHAVDAVNGTQEWVFDGPQGFVESSPTAAGGTVYVGTGDGTLYAVDADSGDRVWAFTRPADSVDSSPTVVDGTVYVGSSDGTLYAVNAAGAASSEGSRVSLGTLGHHHVWADEQSIDTGVTGVVERAGTGDPVEGATVTLGNETTVTGSDGSFRIFATPDTYDLTVSGVGVNGTTQSVTVGSGSFTDVGAVEVTTELDVAVRDGQPSAVTDGDDIQVTLETANAANLTVELAGNYSVGDADLFVDSDPVGFGEQLPVDDGQHTVTVETAAGQFGNVTLEHTVSAGGAETTVSTGPTPVLETEPGKLVWEFETDDAISSSPTVVDGTVFLGSSDNSVYALNATDGKRLWEFDTGNDVRSSPTVVNGIVYVSAKDVVYALDADSGAKVWEFETQSWPIASPTVAGDTVYLGSRYALNASTGEQKWEFSAGSVLFSAATVVDGTVFAGSGSPSGGTLYALDAETGSEEWSFATGERVRSSPTVADGTVYVGSNDGSVYALDASNGSEEWSFTTGGEVESSPTVADGTVYIGSNDGSVYALDAGTGSEVWQLETGSRIESSPTVAGGTVFVGTGYRDRALYAIDADSGEKTWEFETGEYISSAPTVVDGTAFFASIDRTVYAVGAGVRASSEGSRVGLGTLGHHYAWADSQGLDTSVEGVVESGGDPVEGATVEVDGRLTETGADGSFQIVAAPGTHALTVSALGFEGTTRTVEVAAGDDPKSVGTTEIAPTLDLAVVDGQRATVADGNEIVATVEVANANTLTVDVSAGSSYLADNATLAVDGAPADFGSAVPVDDGKHTVTVGTTRNVTGDLGLEHTVSDAGGNVTVSTGPTTVFEPDPGDTVWTFSTGDTVASSPTVVDDTVFVGSWDNSVYAVDRASGTADWVFETDDLVTGSPAVAEGTVYVGSGRYDGNVYAINASDGSEEWSFDTGRRIESSPTVVDDTVYVGSSGGLYALNASTGDRQWDRSIGSVESSPTVVDGTVFVGASDFQGGGIYAVDAATGSEVWRFETGQRIRSSPTVANGTVYVGSDDGSAYALDAATGSEEWSFDTGGKVWSSPTVANGTVYVGSHNGSVHALDAADGSAEWSFAAGREVESSPTVANGTVYVGSEGFNKPALYALDANSGDQRWALTDSERGARSSPTVVNGTVYIGSDDSNLYAANVAGDASSDGTRVTLGTLGHHYAWAGTSPPGAGNAVATAE